MTGPDTATELTMGRRRLPNRRGHELLDFEHAGIHYTAGIGRFDDGSVAEVFLNTAKHGTAVDINARDAAVAASLLRPPRQDQSDAHRPRRAGAVSGRRPFYQQSPSVHADRRRARHSSERPSTLSQVAAWECGTDPYGLRRRAGRTRWRTTNTPKGVCSCSFAEHRRTMFANVRCSPKCSLAG
jgi:hypothetical protein